MTNGINIQLEQNNEYKHFEKLVKQFIKVVKNPLPTANTENINLKNLVSQIKSYGYVNASERLNYLLTLNKEDLGNVAVAAKDESILDFSTFMSNKFFNKSPKIGLSRKGNLSIDMDLQNNDFVGIDFCGHSIVNYIIIKNGKKYIDKCNIQELLDLLVELKIDKS